MNKDIYTEILDSLPSNNDIINIGSEANKHKKIDVEIDITKVCDFLETVYNFEAIRKVKRCQCCVIDRKYKNKNIHIIKSYDTLVGFIYDDVCYLSVDYIRNVNGIITPKYHFWSATTSQQIYKVRKYNIQWFRGFRVLTKEIFEEICK